MSISIDLTQGLELRDSSGRSIFFTPDELVQQLKVERDRLRGELAEMQARLATTTAERDQLHVELGDIRVERDEYRKAMHFQTQERYVITREWIADMEKNGLSFDQVIEQVEQVIKGPAHG